MTDGRHVIVSFGSQGLYAYDLDGKLLWQKDLGVLNSGWFFDPDYEWGLGSSPIIYKNMVIVQCDIQRNSFLAAFDTDTGQGGLAHSARRDSFVVDADDLRGGRQGGARHAGDHVHARLRSDDGQGALEVLGQLRDRDPDADRRPRRRRHHERLPRRAADFRDQARAPQGDITLQNKATKSDFVSWSTTRGGPYIPTPIIYGDQLYVLQNNGVLAAYKVGTGEQVYQKRLGEGGSFSASPVAADGKIYCSSEDGDVYVIKAGAEYEELAKNSIGEVLMATPAISDGLIIFRGLKNVYAIKAR